MVDIRIHGRAGQGVVSAAEMLAIAAFADGRYAHSTHRHDAGPLGEVVTATCRITDVPTTLADGHHDPVAPDVVLVLDAELLGTGLLADARPDTLVVVDTDGGVDGLAFGDAPLERDQVVTVPAAALAERHLGRPLGNAAFLGVLAALDVISLSSVVLAIDVRFRGDAGESNATVARAAYRLTVGVLGGLTDPAAR